MQIVFHLGAHCTDEDRLLRTLLRNRGTLAGAGVAVPPPGRYRPMLRDTLNALRGRSAPREVQEQILDAALDDQKAHRIVLSNETMLGVPQRVVSDQGFLSSAGRRAAALAGLFPDDEVSFFLALRNPATLIPALLRRNPDLTFPALMADTRPEDLLWTPVVEAIRDAAPEARLTVWCNEDSALLWPDLLRALAGLGEDTVLEGDDEMAAQLMPAEATAQMRAYLAEHPPLSARHRRRVTAVFLERFARPEAIEEDVAVPGWTETVIDRITARYEADWDRIRGLPGITALDP